ncbi:MAG: host-nuclease inhibitor Gam family protein [Bacteroides stercoris]
MARTKKTVVSGISREQAEQAFADFAAADAKVQNLTSKMDLEMTRIREKYAWTMLGRTGSPTKEKNFDIMQAYAVENKEELFSRKKSLESAHGVFGFRTGTPKLKNLKGFTWAAVTNICKELLPQYIRTTDELAKDKLLADRDNPEVAEYFPKIGVQVVQEETFYVEPKKENDAQQSA